jgi:tetratricopeptide (TPR) repeat protein
MDTQPSTEFDRLVEAGLAASRASNRDDALALFAQASQCEPSSGIPHFLIASEHASAGDFAAAELAFASAVVLSPDFPLARYQLGLLQFSSQRAPLALLTWQPLFSLREDDALLHFVRGFASLAQDAFADSLRHFRTGLDCPPANTALCSDVLQVVAAIEALDRPPSSEDAPVESHVLVSAYARGLH